MNSMLWFYLLFYAGFVVFTHAVEYLSPDDEDPTPSWERVVDSVLLLVGGAGIIFFIKEAADPSLKLIWKGVAPLLTIVHLGFLTRDWRDFTAKNLHRKEPETFWPTLMLTLFVVGPAVVLNLLFAFR